MIWGTPQSPDPLRYFQAMGHGYWLKDWVSSKVLHSIAIEGTRIRRRHLTQDLDPRYHYLLGATGRGRLVCIVSIFVRSMEIDMSEGV